jgi:hypothetical protein
MIQASISTFKDAGVLEDYTIDYLKMCYSCNGFEAKEITAIVSSEYK